MELTVTLAAAGVDADAVAERLAAALRELFEDLGLEASPTCRVAAGGADAVLLDGQALGVRWPAPEPGSPDRLARAILHALTPARAALAAAALPAGAPAAHRRVVAELAGRCLGLGRCGDGDLDRLAGLPPGELAEALEAAVEQAEVRLLAPDPEQVLGAVDLDLEAGERAALEADGDLSPAAAWVRRELRDRLGLLVPVIAADERTGTAGGAAAGALRLRINDVRLPPIDDDADAAGRLRSLLARDAGALVTAGSTRCALDRLAERFPDLVQAVTELHGLTTMTRTLRYLAEEGVSIGRLRMICDAVLEAAGTSAADERALLVVQPYAGKLYPLGGPGRDRELGPERRAECVRMSLARQLSHDAKRGSGQIHALLLDSGAEAWLTDAGQIGSEHRASLVAAVDRAAGDRFDPLILTNTAVRRRLWEALHPARPEITVLGYPELASDASIVPLGRVEWSPPAR